MIAVVVVQAATEEGFVVVQELVGIAVVNIVQVLVDIESTSCQEDRKSVETPCYAE